MRSSLKVFRGGRVLVLTALLLGGVVLSLVYIYKTHTLPIERQVITTLAAYEHRAVYRYLAHLKPNYLYNRTILVPGEGLLYLRITKYLTINMSYLFLISRSSDIHLNCSVTMILESPAGWSKVLEERQVEPINVRGNEASVRLNFVIRPGAYWNIIEVIEQETGTSSSEYWIKIVPRIHVVADTGVGIVNETFIPTLSIGLRLRTDKGDIIVLEGLSNARKGSLTKTVIVMQKGLLKQRYFAYASTVSLASGLIASLVLYFKSRPKVTPLARTLRSLKGILAKISEEPIHMYNYTLVKVSSVEDLIKISDNLAKPILMSRIAEEGKEMLALYVIDGTTKYQYQIELPKNQELEL